MSDSPVRVAVVDDDAAVLESACFLLEVVGYAVEPFASARAFLDDDAADRVDCLILDHHMPDLTGLDLAQQLRAAGSSLPIMLISGAMTPEIVSRAANLGLQKVVEKPVSDEAMMCFVERVRQA